MNVEDEARLAVYEGYESGKGGFCPDNFLASLSERLILTPYQIDRISRQLEHTRAENFLYPDAKRFFQILPDIDKILPIFFSQGEPPRTDEKVGFQKRKIVDSGVVESLGAWWDRRILRYGVDKYLIGFDKDEELRRFYKQKSQLFGDFGSVDYIDDTLKHLRHAEESTNRLLNRDINLFLIDRKDKVKDRAVLDYPVIETFDDYLAHIDSANQDGRMRLLLLDWDRTCWDTDGWKNWLMDQVILINGGDR